MRSSTIVGVVFLVLAAGLAATQFILPRSGEVAVEGGVTPMPIVSHDIPVGPDVENDWQTLSPHHVAYPRTRPHRRPHHKPTPKPHAVAQAQPTPLPAPTFLPSTPEPTPEVVVIHRHIEEAPDLVQPARPPIVSHPVHPHHRKTPPPGPSAADIARQRMIARAALVDQAKRTASGLVISTIPGVALRSVEADDRGATIGVVAVENRQGATAVENFVFRTSASGGLALVERRTVSVSQADPFVGGTGH